MVLAVRAGAMGSAAPPAADPGGRPAADSPLLCLMYHRFVDAPAYARLHGKERIYSMPVERFERQLQRLRAAGYHGVTAEDAVAFARGRRDLPRPAVLITIDDGCRSALTRAQPLLRKYGFRATLFVTTDPQSRVFDAARPDQARLTDAELRGLDPQVFDVQAHGVTHRPLTRLSDAELSDELCEARETLERLTGRPARYLAVPGNWYDERVLRFARREGYEAVFTSDRGLVRRGADPWRLPRWNVAGYLSERGFIELLGAPNGRR
jgi:peptidoglycan/xylan/chitin deacetylase (PgdA/CDA1 family)